MSILGTFNKQPDEVLDYDFDFSEWLTERDDTIASVTAEAEPGLTLPATVDSVDNPSHANGIVKVFTSGGTDKARYKVTVTVTTAAGRVKQAEIAVRVKEV